MSADSTIYTSTAYQAFFAIDPGEFKEKIRFIDRNRMILDSLTLSEYVEVMDAFAEALFETGRYERHLAVADELIALSIEHNISRVGDRDLYFETLFQKAASLYNLERTEEAVHILQELIKMDPHHESARLFLINCHVRKHSALLARVRSASAVCILASAIVIAIELLLVRPTWPAIVSFVEMGRNTLFIGGTGLLIAGELWVRYKAVGRMYAYVRQGKTKTNEEK